MFQLICQLAEYRVTKESGRDSDDTLSLDMDLKFILDLWVFSGHFEIGENKKVRNALGVVERC